MGACVPQTEAVTGEAIGLGAEKAEAHLLPWVCLAGDLCRGSLSHGLSGLANMLRA